MHARIPNAAILYYINDLSKIAIQLYLILNMKKNFKTNIAYLPFSTAKKLTKNTNGSYIKKGFAELINAGLIIPKPVPKFMRQPYFIPPNPIPANSPLQNLTLDEVLRFFEP